MSYPARGPRSGIDGKANGAGARYAAMSEATA
jgi:hypothetical protein